MRQGVVHPFKHRIFKRKATLVRKVVLPEQRHDFLQAVLFSAGINRARWSANGLCRLTAR